MQRLSTEYIIQQIEALVNDSTSRIGQTQWTVRGVECRRERHGHSGQYYSFDLDVLNVRTKPGEGARWELFLVTEFWRSSDGTSLHRLKWLKLTAGKAPDVFKWIQKHRDDWHQKATEKRPQAAMEPTRTEVSK